MVQGILKRCPTGLQILKVCHWAPTLQRGTLLDANGPPGESGARYYFYGYAAHRPGVALTGMEQCWRV